MKATYSQRLIKLADLNHHQTFFAGRSTLTVYTKMYRSREPEKIAADGFATFSYLDENHHSKPHGVVITPETEDEKWLNKQAIEVLEESKQRAKAMNAKA